MVLKELVKVIKKEQEIAVFQGFLIKYMGVSEMCNDAKLLEATVKQVEQTGNSINIFTI